jgi:hypothetical protein
MKLLIRTQAILTSAIGLSIGLPYVGAQNAHAQPVPLANEFVVNSYTTGHQYGPSVGRDADGNFVVVWSVSYRNGPNVGSSIHGQRYDLAGAPLGTEFVASELTITRPSNADVGVADDGSFLVVWRERQPSIVARGFDDQGTPSGSSFRVDSTIFTDAYGYEHGYEDHKDAPAVAAGAQGRFMVVWAGGYNLYQYHLHHAREIRGQVVNGMGAFVGSEFTVGGDLYYEVLNPEITSDQNGQFVVAWNDLSHYNYPEPTYYERVPVHFTVARRFDADGVATSDRVTAGGSADSAAPSVGADAGGRFIVAWADQELGSGYDVDAGRFDASSNALGDMIEVTTEAGQGEVFDSGRRGSAVAVNSTGHFAVAWSQGADGYDSIGDGDSNAILARSYAPDGTPQGDPIVVNNYTTGSQYAPAVVFTNDDELLIAWSSDGPDGSDTAVVARRFARSPSCGDASADGAKTATDALLALTAAVGTGVCALCVCDANGSGLITATDALLILNDAIGNAVTLTCTTC